MQIKIHAQSPPRIGSILWPNGNALGKINVSRLKRCKNMDMCLNFNKNVFGLYWKSSLYSNLITRFLLFFAVIQNLNQ